MADAARAFVSFACATWLVLLVAACGDDQGTGSGRADTGADGAADTGVDSDAGVEDGGGDASADADVGAEIDASGDASLLELDLVPGCNPFAMSDECFLPFPSAFFQTADPTSETGVRLAYHDQVVELPPDSPPIDFGAFGGADGVAPSSAILVHFKRDLAEDQLIGQEDLESSLAEDAPIAMFNLATGERFGPFMVEMDRNQRDGHDGRHALIIRPLRPMAAGDRHVVVLTQALRDAQGDPLESPPAFAALRDGVLTAHPEIEALRPGYEEIFELLEEGGYPSDGLLLAWDFQVASREFVLGSVLSMRETALAAVASDGVEYLIDSVDEAPNEDVLRIVEGTFEVPTFLTEDLVLDYDEDHHPRRQETSQSFEFTLMIPATAEALAPMPLVIMGHGIFGNGRDLLTQGAGAARIQSVATEVGGVLVATDWIGLSDGDLNLIISEVLPDLNRIDVITDRLQQSLINNLVLQELTLGELQDDAQVWTGEQPLLDGQRVYYYGVSLGGIQGTSFVSLSQRVERAVLAVPGGGWSHMINRSIVFDPIRSVANAFYPDPLHQQIYIAVIQGFFDHSDPINLSQLLFVNPLPDAPEERIVIFQEGIGDALVPNLTTRMLARAADVAQLMPAIERVTDRPAVEGPVAESVMTQILLPELLNDYRPAEDNTVPEQDNGVHRDAVFAQSAIDQVIHLFQTGLVEQFCDDACDPD